MFDRTPVQEALDRRGDTRQLYVDMAMTLPGTQHLGIFIMAGLLLNVTPGPDTMYILGRTLAQGRLAGIASVLGISTGCLVHTFGAALGCSAILARSAAAFSCIKLAGAAYLIYLGIRMLCERRTLQAASASGFPARSGWVIYRQAIFTNALNPKVALFFLAFLPQFVAPDAATHITPFLFLGLVFIFNGTLYCLALVLCASVLTEKLRRNSSFTTAFRRVTGAMFIGLGLRLALEKQAVR